jgi:hypothetical protein
VVPFFCCTIVHYEAKIIQYVFYSSSLEHNDHHTCKLHSEDYRTLKTAGHLTVVFDVHLEYSNYRHSL